MGGSAHQLHIFFLPLMAHGHTIPTVDMAKLFASRGLRATIITTPANASLVSKTIQKSKNLGLDIDIKTIKFPAGEVGLTEGYEHADAIRSDEIDIASHKKMTMKFCEGVLMLQAPFEKLLEECRPDCLVADSTIPWATDAATKLGIPRLVFHAVSLFSLCATESVRTYSPHKKVSSDSEPFALPHLPGDIKFTRDQLPDYFKQGDETFSAKTLQACKESELKSFGVIVNSFYELEPAYADHYRNVLGMKAWHIGPVSLCNTGIADKAERGKEASINQHECLKWFDSKEPNSVVYVCFGSFANLNAAQLKEIAMGLEASGQQFIWVVRRSKNSQNGEEDWLPAGFEKRMDGKGLIVRGWAPQLVILGHEATGGFVTHCGWNSTLEGITAGKSMLTWPIFAEQFYNEKLVTEVLRIGVSVGVKKWKSLHGDYVSSDAVEKGVGRLMVGEEAKEMRCRAKKLAEMASMAVKEGGSSSSDFDGLIQELMSCRK